MLIEFKKHLPRKDVVISVWVGGMAAICKLSDYNKTEGSVNLVSLSGDVFFKSFAPQYCIVPEEYLAITRTDG